MEIVDMVSNASVASENAGDGRNIALVIVDTTNRPDIEALVNNHNYYGQGEVATQWARFGRNKNMIGLHLEFIKPSKCNVLLNFDITKSGALVDLIISSQALYIQPGKPGDRLSNTLGADKIMIEVPSSNFREEWEAIYLTQMTKYFKNKQRVSRRKAEKMAESFIDKMKILDEIRMPK